MGHHQLDKEGLLLSPHRKNKRKDRGVSYHRQMENKLTPAAKCEGNFNVSETKRCTDREDSSKSYESNAF